jgi:hypothetical protein
MDYIKEYEAHIRSYQEIEPSVHSLADADLGSLGLRGNGNQEDRPARHHYQTQLPYDVLAVLPPALLRKLPPSTPATKLVGPRVSTMRLV